MIQINKTPGQLVLELGGGGNPHPASDVNVDVRSGPMVSFVADFNKPLPISSNEFDAVICQYVLEHLSYRNVVAFLKEVFRVLKPSGRALFTIPNTKAQIRWMIEHPEGWDGRDFFSSASGLLFGDQDYEENAHKCYFDPETVNNLFLKAGFSTAITTEYGERDTDLFVDAQAYKPSPPVEENKEEAAPLPPPEPSAPVEKTRSLASDAVVRPVLFNKHYFNGGGKVGGYAFEGYRDFPVHEITAAHILARQPESVLELGCARGYVLKKVMAKGIPGWGMEISKHCYMTRCCDLIYRQDSCITPWDFDTEKRASVDLCYSVAFLEHVPEECIDGLIQEMKKYSKRGLHGIDFGHNDDGFDKTHCLLRPRQWWIDKFREHDYPCEVLDKEELESGEIPRHVIAGDGSLKINVGSFTTMFHHGWVNLDIHDLRQYAAGQQYNFIQWDARNGLPFRTGEAKAIVACHFLEHLSYEHGKSFLRECRRVLDPKVGVLRIQVPDADLLIRRFMTSNLHDYDEINDGCEKATTHASKLHSLLWEGHLACYDNRTLMKAMEDSGFDVDFPSAFETRQKLLLDPKRKETAKQILDETLDTFPCLTLYAEAFCV